MLNIGKGHNNACNFYINGYIKGILCAYGYIYGV